MKVAFPSGNFRTAVSALLINATFFLVLFALIFLLVLPLHPGYVDTADRFFSCARIRDYDSAYKYLAPDLRIQMPYPEFLAWFKQKNLIFVDVVIWDQYTLDKGGVADLHGTIVTRFTDPAIPARSKSIHMVLRKELRRWMIQSIDY